MLSGLDKVNITVIISDYLSTLKRRNGKTYIVSDVVLFFVLPFVASFSLVYFGVSINEDFSTLLIGIYSIFTGLLFSLLIFMFDVIARVHNFDLSVRAANLRIKTFRDIYFSASFEILICLLSISILLLSSFAEFDFVNKVFDFLIFYSVILFMLSLLTILKIIHKLLSREVETQKELLQKRAVQEGEKLYW